ncbi:MAG: hypothetical protein HDT21_07865 [Ruminococcus sp.]|nr:hypothetical protein [Ruminococcus sp.]
MEENTNIPADKDQDTEKMTGKHYTKQQNALYTVLSVGLFLILYFGGGKLLKLVNRSYRIYCYPEAVSEESLTNLYDICGISSGSGIEFEGARLRKDGGFEMMALFSGIEDEDYFAENCIDFEYGDVAEDIRTEFYPYRENPSLAEYAYADRYVDIDDPNRYISVFVYNGEVCAEYTYIGKSLPPEVKAFFADGEKVY